MQKYYAFMAGNWKRGNMGTETETGTETGRDTQNAKIY